MLYIIMGMHKSGTTLVAETLHKSGIDMGCWKETFSSYDLGHKYERTEILKLNIELLKENEVEGTKRWYLKKLPVGLNIEQQKQLVKIVFENSNDHKDWGFKDPRLTLTYPLLKSFLPEHKLIMIYRSPDEVARHYASKNPYHIFKFYKIWFHYNYNMLVQANSLPKDRYIILNYNDFIFSAEKIYQLENFVSTNLLDIRDKSQYRNRVSINKNNIFKKLIGNQQYTFRSLVKRLEYLS